MCTIDIRTTLSPKHLAADIDRDATPDFKVSLVQELFRLDPVLELEVINAVRKASCKGN